MKLFACDNCQQTLYFENSRCVNCGETVAYQPEFVRLATVKSGDRQCRNALERDACNWLITDADAEYCRACTLSAVIPDLSDPVNELAWRRIEAAKRGALHARARLPVRNRAQDPETGLAFRFLKGSEDEPVMTGHDDGVITLNIDGRTSRFARTCAKMGGLSHRAGAPAPRDRPLLLGSAAA
jgi:hypothetical protein